MAKRLNCDHAEKVLECMQSKNGTEVASMTLLFGKDSGAFLPPWNGVPDLNFTNDPYFLEDAEILLSTGQFNTEIDVIIGTNKDEGTLGILSVLQGGLSWDDYSKSMNWPSRLFNIANNSDITSTDMEKAYQVLEFYIGNDLENNINEEHMQGIIDMFTDADFLYGSYKTINYLLEQNMNVYQYILTFRGSYSVCPILFGYEPVGVSHADDLIYLWDPVFGYNNISIH